MVGGDVETEAETGAETECCEKAVPVCSLQAIGAPSAAQQKMRAKLSMKEWGKARAELEHFDWAQCDDCDKWRILDQQVDQDGRFTCTMAQRNCIEPEDKEEDCARRARVVSHGARALLQPVHSRTAHRSAHSVLYSMQTLEPGPSPGLAPELSAGVEAGSEAEI